MAGTRLAPTAPRPRRRAFVGERSWPTLADAKKPGRSTSDNSGLAVVFRSRPLSFANEDPTWWRPRAGSRQGAATVKVAGTVVSCIPATPIDAFVGG